MKPVNPLCKLFVALVVLSAALLPLASSAQCPDATITIEIFTDNYPEETTWGLVDQNSGATISSDDLSISGLPNTLYTWNVCVSATGCYDFTISDAFGDGICCAEGSGYYNVYFNGTLVSTGGAFTFSETVTSIGGCSTSGCPDGTVVLQIFTDSYPAETSWQLEDNTTGAIVASDDLSIGGTAATLYTWNICVSTNGCYDFTIFDDFGDGICCGVGSGYYNLYFNGALIKTGGSFAASEVTQVGSCSQGTCTQCSGNPPPLNDACSGATNLGLLTPPTACPGGTGAAQVFQGSNVCASAEFPYSYIIGCQTGGDMSAPSSDVWYQFQITGSELVVNVSSSLRGVSLGLWQDAGAGCTGLVARNCAETIAGGNLAATFSALNAGIYYLQVSGMDTLDQCNFTLSLTNNQDCAACIQQNNLTASPPPVNGRYQAGTTVTFTYTVLNYNQTSVNWIHGIVPHFGPGWDLSTLTNQVAPVACGSGAWGWYNQVITGLRASDGPGFFFESTLGCATICDATNPGDNFGDQGVSITCPLTFQWTISTVASCPPGQTGDDLNIEIFNYGDSETGSWTQPACDNDPNYLFFARLFCCDSSLITVENAGCFGAASGSITVQGVGIPPYNYELLDASGNFLQGSLADTAGHTFSNLSAGDYQVKTTDENLCEDLQQVVILQSGALNISGTVTNVSCNGGSNGSIDISPSGGTAPYTYSWSNGSTGEDLTGVSAGAYSPTVFDANGCSGTASFTVSEPAAIANTVVSVQICDGESYFAGGADQTVSGTYFDTLITSAGCDSVVETQLTVLQNAFSPVSVLICDGESYFVGGDFQTETGIYYDTLTSSNGCDSIIETTLEVLPVFTQNQSAFICQGDSFFAGGAYQTESGTYFDSLQTAFGCDSIIVTELTVGNVIVENVSASICPGDSLFVGGGFQTEAGFYSDTFATASGCDSVVVTELIILQATGSNQQVSICAGDSIFAGGDFQTEAGIYFDTFPDVNGCDSIVTTEVIVLPVSSSTVPVSICDGESYFAGGDFQTESGTYIDVVAGANGCDSIITTELTVLPNVIGNTTASICDGDSYFVGGDFQTQPGTYYDTLAGANGCDSIVITELFILPHSFTTVPVSICDGDSYFAGGADQTVSGTYFDTLIAANGCDSVITTELTVLPTTASTVQVSICDGESYFAGGADQTESGTYTDVVAGSNGCDSTITTELTVLPHSFSNVAVSICDGETYFVGGDFQTEKGTYYDTLVAANGCDSIVITELDVLPTSFTTLQVSICDGDSYFVGGDFQTQAGTYYDTLTAANGCDSILATDLLIIPPSQGFTQASICEGDSYFAGGADQTESGFYTDTLTGSNGCDSILTTQLTVIPPSGGFTQASICEGDSYFVGGADQTEAGFYYDTLVGSNGCDSILTTELIVIAPSFGNAVASICEGDSYFVGGDYQTEAGFYVDVLVASNGCDSILTTQLIVLPNPTSSQSFTVCAGEGVFAGGAFQTTSGTYYDTFTAANGCDSILTTALTVGEPLNVNFDVNELSCNCTNQGGSGTQSCAFDISGLAHGTHVDSLFISSGTTVVAVPNPGGRPDAIIYNTNGNWTEDPDLNVGQGNVIIINENPNNNDGDGTGPDDNGSGGTLRFLFDNPVTVVSFLAVDIDKPNVVAKAYDASNTLIASVPVPQLTNGSVQTVSVNASGVKRFDIIYHDSGGFRLNLECNSNCEADLSGFAHGEIVTGEEIAPGVIVSGTSNKPAQFPNAVAIFNSDVTGSLDPDLEAGVGNLLILPEYLTDNNGDGNIDNPSDASAGGTMTFTFDRDRTVYEITLVDNDKNNGTIKAYDANNNLLTSVTTPSGAGGSVQTYSLNVAGVRRLEVSYWDSRGVTGLKLDCLPVNCCDGNATAAASGGFPPYQFAWSTGSTSEYSGDSLCAGVYTVTVTDALGCTAEVSVSLVRADVTLATAQICEGDSILLGGAYQTEAGFYYDTTGGNSNCYQILKTELTILSPSASTQDVQICEGGSYFAGGADQTESGTYFDTYVAANGCDSVVTTVLTVVPAPVVAVQAQICAGDSYFAGGADQTQPGTYYDTLSSASGCDSIVVTELSVLQSLSTTVQASICQGGSYFAGGAAQTESGTYYDTLVSSFGCDSVIITELTVLPAGTTTVDVSICEGESYFAGGADQTESGTYYDTISNGGGCDSILITNLTVSATIQFAQQASICEGDSFFAGGAFQTESGTYVDSFVSSGGCDSIVTTELTVSQTLVTNLQASVCEGDSFFAGGAFQTESGTYIDSFVSSGGCDSLVLTELTVTGPQLSASVIDVSCFGASDGVIDLTVQGGAAPYIFAWSNNVSKEDNVGVTFGPYSVTVTDANGCSVSAGYFVNQPAPLALGAVAEPVTCNGGNDGSIDLFAQGGTAPYTYFWIETGETTEDISGLSAGFYTVEVTDANGCEATVIVEVLEPEPALSNLQVTICEGESYFAGGADQTQAGTYFDTLVSPLGCDSIVITDLTVLPVTASNTQASICEGESYFAGGDFQTESGTYYDTLTGANGCDSIIVTELTVLPAPVSNIAASICEGESYFAGGDFQTESGTYYDTLAGTGSCDSIVITELTVLPASVSNVAVSICEGQSYFAGGDFQTESGIYFDSLTAASGCDSIIITELSVLESLSTVVEVSICEGQSYFAGGADQTEQGTYFDTLAAAGGCDSVIVTELTVIPASSENVNAMICEGESYFAGGDFQTESGTYFDTLATAGGCDSIVITNLTVLPASASTVDVTICDGETYFAGGADQTESGTYFDTYTSSNGCDSTVTTNLTVLPAQMLGIEAVICEGESYFAGGDFQTESGTYYDTLQTTAGCDSIIATDLLVLPALSSTEAVSICQGESYFAGGDFQTESGTYFDTLVAAGGCDSIVTTELTVLDVFVTNADVTICNGESYFAGGDFQTESGTYFDTFTAATGCDSILITQLTVTSPDITSEVFDVSCFGGNDGMVDVTVSGGTEPYTFTWSNNTSDEDVSGLTFGSYSVTVVDANGCSASAGFFIEQPAPLALGAVPTPASCNGESDGAIDLVVQGGNPPYTYDWNTGDNTEDISGIAAGFYTVVVTDNNGCQATVIVQVLEPDAIGLTAVVTDETVSGAADGAIDLTVTGGTAPFLYLWSNGQTTEDISTLSEGTYSVTVIDDNGCEASASFDVIALLPPKQPGVNQGTQGEFDLFAFPNPFEDNVIVRFDAEKAGDGIMLFRDLLGRTMMERKFEIVKGENELQVKFSMELASGIYFIEVVQGNGEVSGVKTLIKE